MSESINDGGPAFPNENFNTEDSREAQFGMSLRDYFAAKALPGLMGRDWSHMKVDDMTLIATWAASSYTVADAMLKARSEK
jgi:hypothetical protein